MESAWCGLVRVVSQSRYASSVRADEVKPEQEMHRTATRRARDRNRRRGPH
jgi:hypothetical protein